MKYIIGGIFIIGGFALAAWLAIWVMLYGGIMASVNNWGIDDGAVVWGIVRAVLCEAGIIPGLGIAAIGFVICSKD